MGRGYMTKTEKLAQLYKKANGCNEDFPAELMNKLSLYGQILEIIGGLHAEAVGDWRLKEAIRRETISTCYSLDPEGSNKDRENKAEMAGSQARQAEGDAEREATRWKNAYISTQEQIQIMKKRYDHLVNVSKGGI
jgi:hypothetical protein